jgi:hypothetical protein
MAPSSAQVALKLGNIDHARSANAALRLMSFANEVCLSCQRTLSRWRSVPLKFVWDGWSVASDALVQEGVGLVVRVDGAADLVDGCAQRLQ